MLKLPVNQLPRTFKKYGPKIGMESDAYMVDDTGMEVALGGLNATLRDYAKFGQLYLNKGNWNGNKLFRVLGGCISLS